MSWTHSHHTLPLLVLLSLGGLLLRAQTAEYFTPVPLANQRLRGSVALLPHENEGVIGVLGKAKAAGWQVDSVRPGQPAADADLRSGDIILSVDGISMRGSQDLSPITRKRDGETAILEVLRGDLSLIVPVTVRIKKYLYSNDPAYRQEREAPPGVDQPILGGRGRVLARMFRSERDPSQVFLKIMVQIQSGPPVQLDDSRYFVLDGTGQQARHVSLEELKYSIGLSVASNWKGGNYAPPPPPPSQPQYIVSSTATGSYAISNMGGGMSSISGMSNGTYTVTQQPDYNQLAYSIGAAIGSAIRDLRDARSNQKLAEQGKAAIAQWEQVYFNSQSPVVPGETRRGQILYWSGSARRLVPPFRALLLFTDPITQKEESVTFVFGDGGEKIRATMSNQAEQPSSASRSQELLTNRDVVAMVEAGLGAEILIAKINTSRCAFDTSPASLRELKDAGVPESVMLIMVRSSSGR